MKDLERIELDPDVARELAMAAAEHASEEACGVLLGRFPGASRRVVEVSAGVPAANVAADPAQRFEVDPSAIVRAESLARASGERIVGFWHSHPTADEQPSRDDVRGAWPGYLMLIVTPRTCAAWLRTETGVRSIEVTPRPLRTAPVD